MNIRDILNRATASLEKAGLISARLDAELLLSFNLNCDRLELYKAPEKSLAEVEIAGFVKLIERRAQGEPVAYITGEKEFWSLLFEVNKEVLVPRPETEILVEETLKAAADLGKRELQILEIGVGSGAVSVALAGELPCARLVATDISARALALARRNARNCGVEERIDFRCGSFFEPLSEIFDIIVSNPPYISSGEFEQLPREIREYEPRQALLAGDNGIECHRVIIAGSKNHLQRGGWLLMEMGAGQRKNIEEMLMISCNYECIGCRCDYGGVDRVIRARKT
jgi:release factor glutamine methyltransferase